MQIEKSVKDTVFEARLKDRMTFSDHAPFRALLEDITNAKAKKCVFDLSGLTSIDSAALGMFAIALDQGKKHGWTVALRSPQGQVRSLLELAKFDKLLAIEG